MKIFVLKTGLFPENASLEEAISTLESDHEASYLDTRRSNLTDEDWDKAVQAIMTADQVLTL